MRDRIKILADEIYPQIINIRRELHKNPEMAFCEVQSGQIIKAHLDLWGIPYKNVARTGICAVIEGGRGGKTIAIRADMDALPITEQTGLAFCSQNEGVMHACGHDAHMASLIGAAFILNSIKNELCGTVKLFFQPAEEGVGGAVPMIEDGVMQSPTVEACIAAHVTNEYPVGVVQVLDGPVMASPDDFDIAIHGRGGHGGWPHECIDPIVCAAYVVTALQTAVSRFLPPTLPGVITIGSIIGGNTYNVIPDTVYLKGTARSIDEETRRQLPLRIEKILKGVTEAMGCTYDFDYKWMYPPTINDNEMCSLVRKAAAKHLGEDKVISRGETSMGGEDFAYFAQMVPSCYFKMGVANEKKGIIYPIHNAKFDIDEEALRSIAVVMAQACADFLNEV